MYIVDYQNGGKLTKNAAVRGQEKFAILLLLYRCWNWATGIDIWPILLFHNDCSPQNIRPYRHRPTLISVCLDRSIDWTSVVEMPRMMVWIQALPVNFRIPDAYRQKKFENRDWASEFEWVSDSTSPASWIPIILFDYFSWGRYHFIIFLSKISLSFRMNIIIGLYSCHIISLLFLCHRCRNYGVCLNIYYTEADSIEKVKVWLARYTVGKRDPSLFFQDKRKRTPSIFPKFCGKKCDFRPNPWRNFGGPSVVKSHSSYPSWILYPVLTYPAFRLSFQMYYFSWSYFEFVEKRVRRFFTRVKEILNIFL